MRFTIVLEYLLNITLFNFFFSGPAICEFLMEMGLSRYMSYQGQGRMVCNGVATWTLCIEPSIQTGAIIPNSHA